MGNIPDGDWINNEGGYGTVILRPQEADLDQVQCDMTYGDDNGEPDSEDEDGEASPPDFNDADPAAVDKPIAIDDTALQPAKGDDQ